MNASVPESRLDWLARVGCVLAGLGSVAAGVLDVIWGEFEPAHQPIQAWGDRIAHIPALAYLAAALLIVGGVALSLRPLAQAGAAALAITYGAFTLFPMPRLFTAPHFLGHHPPVYIGLLVGICQQLILFVPVAALWALLGSKAPHSSAWERLARWIFGLCAVDFGLAHLTGVQGVARMVPAWMPFNSAFWAVVTGVAFIVAGLSILSGMLDVLAARLLGLMLLVFSAAVLTPGALAQPHSHVAWGGDAYNLTAVGSTWICASWLQGRPKPSRNDETSEDVRSPCLQPRTSAALMVLYGHTKAGRAPVPFRKT